MLFTRSFEELSLKQKVAFYGAFASAWLAFAPVVVVFAASAWTLLRATTTALFVSFIAMTPFIVVMARLRWMQYRRGADLGEARARGGARDPLGARGANAKPRLCIVGCGASGVVALRRALDAGFDVVAYEKSSSIGGVWAYAHSSSKVFNSVLQNCSKLNNVFADCRMPETYPFYIGWRLTMQYLQSYCEKFNLGRHVRLLTEVESVRALEDESGFEVVAVTNASSRSSKRHIERFDFVWVCSGQLTTGYVPDVPGLDTFPGTVVHSAQYTVPSPYEGKNVLVVGIGSASGSDIAQELSSVARSVSLVIRTERRVVGRGFVQGSATLINRFAAFCPAWIGVLWNLYFDWYRFCHDLQPAVTDSGDLLNCLLLQKIHRVDLIDHCRGQHVTFVDGHVAQFDAIIFATGYKRDYKFMPDELKPTAGLYEFCILPQDPRVAYVLFVLPFGTHWQLSELQAMFLARVHSGVIPLPSKEKMAELAEGVESIGHHEHLSEFYRMKYLALLAPYIFPNLKTLFHQPRLLMRLMWAPYNAPIGDWLSDSPDRTRLKDVLKHFAVRWTAYSFNKW